MHVHTRTCQYLLLTLQVSLSDVIIAVERLLTPKNPQVQAHAILQYLTREFEYSMPQVTICLGTQQHLDLHADLLYSMAHRPAVQHGTQTCCTAW